MAASSLGKLDAICAKLKSSQQTAVSGDVTNGSIGLDLCKSKPKDEEAFQRPNGSNGRDSDKNGVGLEVGAADVSVLDRGAPESYRKCQRDCDENDAVVTGSKGNESFSSFSNASHGDNCDPANGSSLSIHNTNNNNNNNNKTIDFNEKTESENDQTERGDHQGGDVSKSLNHSNEVPSSSPSSQLPRPPPPPLSSTSSSSSSVDQVTPVPNEDVPHAESLAESSLSREVLSTPIPSLPTSRTSTPVNAQTPSTTPSVSSPSPSSASALSSSLSSQSLSSTSAIQINSVANESETTSELDCKAMLSASCNKGMNEVSSALSVKNQPQSGLSIGVSSNDSLSENDRPLDTNGNIGGVNNGMNHNTDCEMISDLQAEDSSNRRLSSPCMPHDELDVKINSNDNDGEKSSECEEGSKHGNRDQTDTATDRPVGYVNREEAKQNDISEGTKLCSDQKATVTYEHITGAQESSSHVKTTFDLSSSKSVDDLINGDQNTIETSESVPSDTSTIDVKPAVPQPPPSSARKNRRKAAKPQKQVGGRYYTSDNLVEQADMPMETDQSFETEETAEGFARRSPGRADQAPLDLSSGQFDNFSDEAQSMALMGEGPSGSSAQESCNEDDLVSSSIGGGDGQHGDEEEEASMEGFNRRQEERRSSGGESSDSNVMLADYAKHTMTELLGIYGFEGADARNVSLGKVDPSLFPRTTETSSTTTTTASRGKTNKATKSGPFMKKVYTSLMTPPSAGEATKPGFHLQVPALPLAVGSGFPSVAAVGNSQAKDSKIGHGKHLGNRMATVARKNYTAKALNSADFHNYIRRYGNGTDCGGEHCKDLGYRDHYHCLDCPHKVFIRKEEMVRHFKWHKKRQESLQHGFMRYSPVDDCSKRFGSCAHNGRQTHYHCVQRGCDKVYISTSDVQMHANFHRKDSAIIQEGFQRFRATEDCGTTSCAFYGQRTTHFHCRRPQCNFTFKNKSDMEKHKSYHQKDQVLSKDGFKKFMKYESCPYSGCRYSKASNHIHCIRPGCQYVLHSTAQLYSHKRKHERREFENAYRSYRQLQQQTPAQLTDKDAKSLHSYQNQGRPATTGGVAFIPLPATNTSVTSQTITSGQLASGMLTLQGVQLNNKILTSLKADALSSQKSSLVPKREANVASALNLTHQSSVYQLAKVGDTEEERQTMALPVPLALPPVKSEVDDDSMNIGEPCEAEDLSLNKKRKSETIEDGAAVESQSKVFIKDEAYPSSDDNRNPEESVSGVEEEEEEEYDDDDDEDDDDRDYGQVEEPTLVNNLECSGEGDRLSGVSASQPIAAVKKESPESLAFGNVKLEPGTSDVKEEGNTDLAEASAHSPTSASQPRGLLTTLPMHGKMMIERKERDESWKKYLIRYTANDACYSRCACLYKDHYHCRVEGCQVIFKSKDGVRGHARFHENQDSITPLVYSKFDALTACNHPGCPYTEKELHYHCNWTNCKQVIPHSGPTFALLEHYRIHEMGINALNRGTKSTASPMPGVRELDPLQKRRGRPPKYPRNDLPVVPKVHLTEKEIMDSTLAFIHKKFNEESRIINGFKKILSSEKCPDENCMFQSKDHFHCGRKFCHMSTDRLDFLTLHSKDFHNNVTILEGYEFFERNVNCRRPHCHNNRVNRHYHCMRPRCDYSFVRHSTMVQHNKKHPTAPAAVLTPPSGGLPVSSTNKITGQQFVAIAPALLPPKSSSTTITPRLSAPSSNIVVSPSIATRNKLPAADIGDNNVSNTGNITLAGKTIVKSSGTYFPLSGLPNIQLSGIPVQTAPSATTQGQNVVSTSLSGTTALTASGSVPGASVPMVPASPITPVTSAQVIQGAQILQAQNGAPVINTGGMCLTLPTNLASSSIPILTQPAQNQQPTLLTGIIPMGNLATSQSIAPQLVNIPGAQIIATSQGSFLQHNSVLGSNLVQVIQNPITVISSGTAPATSISATPGSTLAMTGSVSGTAAPLTFLLQQQQQQQPQQPGDGSVVPLRWANLKKKMHYPLSINCGRPFCKLKKKDHYHCLDCYQAFSDPARLRIHLSKHGFKFKKADSISKAHDSQQDQIVTKVSQGLDLSFQVKKPVRNKSLADQSSSIPGSSTTSVKKEVDSQGLSSSLNLCPSVFTEMVTKGKEAEEPSSDSAPSKSAEKITLVMSNINSQWTISKGDGKCDSKTSSKQDANAEKKYANGTISTTEDEISFTTFEPGQSVADNDYDSDVPMLMVDEGRDESNDSSLNASSSSLTLCSSLSRKSRQRRPSVRSKDYVDSETIVDARPTKPRRKYKKDFDLPEGFTYVKCSQDCGYTRCAYRQSVTHFHCLRSDCGYGISDRSRIIQHRIRHERLDALMGREFQHFRASVSCERADCEFDEKSSHFHCLRCPYSCADSGRVPAHRKYHAKLDNVSNNGFIKFTGVQDCQTASCYYFRKQTHYHCTFPGCNHSVLGPSQMAPHKLKHAQHSQ